MKFLSAMILTAILLACIGQESTAANNRNKKQFSEIHSKSTSSNASTSGHSSKSTTGNTNSKKSSDFPATAHMEKTSSVADSQSVVADKQDEDEDENDFMNDSGRPNPPEEEALMKELRKLSKLGEDAPGFEKDRGTLLMQLARVKYSSGKYAVAEALFRNSLTHLERGLGSYDSRVVECLSDLIECLKKERLFSEVKALLKKRQHIVSAIAGNPPRKPDKYFDWVKNSAELGHPSAPTLLGLAHLSGEGAGKDPEKAREYFEQAVEQGDGCGITNLGLLYLKGESVEKNMQKAREYLKQAAEYGIWYPTTGSENNGNAQYELGLAAESGIGLRKELKDAYLWYKLAAASGSSKSRLAAERLSEITKNLTPEEKDLFDQKLEVWRENQQLAIYPKFVPPQFAQ